MIMGRAAKRLTAAQWDVLARAVSLAEAEWDADEAMRSNDPAWRQASATLNRAWDRLCEARSARVI